MGFSLGIHPMPSRRMEIQDFGEEEEDEEVYRPLDVSLELLEDQEEQKEEVRPFKLPPDPAVFFP